jgi:hypothetical protein
MLAVWNHICIALYIYICIFIESGVHIISGVHRKLIVYSYIHNGYTVKWGGGYNRSGLKG